MLEILVCLKNCKVYLVCLLKFTDSEHGDLVAVAERPEPVDGRSLTDLHVDAGRVRSSWGASPLPGRTRHQSGHQKSMSK